MTPYFLIVNRGQDYDYSGILLDLQMTDGSKEKSDGFRLRLSDVGNRIILPQKGEKVEVRIGADRQVLKTGVFVVDEVEIEGPPDVISISGSACPFNDDGAGLRAMQRRRSRSWDNITLGALVAGIAGEHGMLAAVAPSLANISISHLDQTSESSMNLLTRLARVYGGIFKPINGTLALAEFGAGKKIDGTPLPVFPIVRGVGMRWRCKLSKRTDFDGVKAQYSDPATGAIQETTTGDTGAAAMIYADPALHLDQQAATASAAATLRSMRQGSCNLSLDLPGIFPVTAEQKLSLTGWREEVNGVWIVKMAHFTLSRSGGLRTAIEAETPGDGSEPREAVINGA